MGYDKFLSFASGVRHGYTQGKEPLLSSADAKEYYGRVFEVLASSYTAKRDILNQFLRGEIDQWEAVDALEEEACLSYDDAVREVSRASSSAVFSERKKRKKSKYHGSLVNNTFDESPTGMGSVGGLNVVSAGLMPETSMMLHPSVRYAVAYHAVPQEKRGMVKSSLSGSLDTFLMQNYLTGLGQADPGPNIKDVGDNGRVFLNFDTESGHSTEVDLGATLETGYVVQSINDELGLFPEGTVDGDLLKLDVVRDIVRSQGERDRVGSIQSSVFASSIEDVPAYWISPDGEILSSVYTHIKSICENPQAFGLTEEYLRQVFADNSEPFASEGNARVVIMRDLLLGGWIRIRYEPRRDVYAVELDKLSNTNKGYLWDWASGLVATNSDKSYSDIYIIEHANNENEVSGSVGDVVSYALFSSVGVVTGTLVPIKSVFEFGLARRRYEDCR